MQDWGRGVRSCQGSYSDVNPVNYNNDQHNKDRPMGAIVAQMLQG